MKKFLSLLLLLAAHAPFAAMAQSPAKDSAWVVTHYTKQEVYIPMRDGVKLFTSLYLPRSVKEKHPILMVRTPYSCNPYGPKAFRNFWAQPTFLSLMKENYIIVLQDVRGKFMSEGDFIDIRPYNAHKSGNETDEASDAYDAIDWLVKNVKNNNGNVGVQGISYPGFFATMAALSGHPALKAVSPQAPVTDIFMGDDMHHNGALFAMDAFSFYGGGFGKTRHGLNKMGTVGYHTDADDNYKFYLDIGAVRYLTDLTGDSIRFWNDMMAHPDYDSWWRTRNTRTHVQHIPDNVATLVVGGLFDAEDDFGAWNLYKAIEKKAHNNNKLVMGPWRHGGWARTTGEYLGNVRFGAKTSAWYEEHIEKPFFDYYLLGKGNVDGIKEANIFFTGGNKWAQFGQWPPLDEENIPLFLDGDGKMWLGERAESLHPDHPASRTYTSDPAKPVPYTEAVHFKRTAEYMDDDQRFASRRPDVLVYETDTLAGDLTLAGPLVADLFTSITTTDADFVVKLIDVFPGNFKYNDSTDGKGSGKDYPMGGYQMLVRGEVMRGRYRNSFENPEPFTPGHITEVKYTLPDVAHIFKKGHRVMVQIQSTWFPLADRNPQQFVDIYHCLDADFVPCDITIYSTPRYPSKIILPVLK